MIRLLRGSDTQSGCERCSLCASALNPPLRSLTSHNDTAMRCHDANGRALRRQAQLVKTGFEPAYNATGPDHLRV